MGRLLNEDDVIDTLNIGAELLRRVLDETDVAGTEREKYEWGLGLIESYISDVKDLPSAQPRKSKWAGKGDSEGFGIFICGACGKFAMMKSNFCPNCGADMR